MCIYIYFSTDIQYKGSWLYKYSISTGKITKYKSFKDAEVLVNGYYGKYISKTTNRNYKYKIYKFNLNMGKSAPVSKMFEASEIGEVTNNKATYYKNTQDGEEIKEYTLKY